MSRGHYNILIIEKEIPFSKITRQKRHFIHAVYEIGIQEMAFYYHYISFSLLKMFDSSSLPNNVFISTLVGTRLHAGCRQESHLLTANYPQLMFKFTFILRIKK